VVERRLLLTWRQVYSLVCIRHLPVLPSNRELVVPTRPDDHSPTPTARIAPHHRVGSRTSQTHGDYRRSQGQGAVEPVSFHRGGLRGPRSSSGAAVCCCSDESPSPKPCRHHRSHRSPDCSGGCRLFFEIALPDRRSLSISRSPAHQPIKVTKSRPNFSLNETAMHYLWM